MKSEIYDSVDISMDSSYDKMPNSADEILEMVYGGQPPVDEAKNNCRKSLINYEEISDAEINIEDESFIDNLDKDFKIKLH